MSKRREITSDAFTKKGNRKKRDCDRGGGTKAVTVTETHSLIAAWQDNDYKQRWYTHTHSKTVCCCRTVADSWQEKKLTDRQKRTCTRPWWGATNCWQKPPQANTVLLCLWLSVTEITSTLSQQSFVSLFLKLERQEDNWNHDVITEFSFKYSLFCC